MNPFARIAAAAIVVVAVLGGAVYLLAPGGGVGGGPPATAAPSPTPSAVPAPSPSASSAALAPLDTTGWTTYTSARYGFSIGHPADWTERLSDHVWSFPADADWLNTASEGFRSAGQTVYATAWSVAVTPGTTVESWIQTYCPKDTTACSGQDRAITVSMDGHPGLLVPFLDDTQAFILVGDRLYAVAVWEPDSDPRTQPYGGAVRLLEGYLSTMRLLPGGPAASATPHPS